MNELFFPAGFGCPAFGNPNLGPEKSWEINFGVEQSLLAERLKMGANYFHREVKDLIEGRPIPGDPFGCFRAQNVGRARFDGVELTLGIKLFEGLRGWQTAPPPKKSRKRELELFLRPLEC